MKLKSLSFFVICIVLSCDNEPVGSSSDNNSSGNTDNFIPSTGYWIYDVSNNWVSVAGATGAVTYNDAEEIAIQLALTI